MNSLQHYIKRSQHYELGQSLFNEEYIEEGIVSFISKKVKNWTKKFVNWLINAEPEDIDNITNDMPMLTNGKSSTDFKNGGLKEYIDSVFNVSNIKTVDTVSDIQGVKNVIKGSGTDANNQKGFWLFEEDLRSDSNREVKKYSVINKEPYYTNYTVFMYQDENQNSPAGMASWSTEYHKYKGDSNKKIHDYFHIYTLMTADAFRGHHLFDKFIKELTRIAKSKQCKGITIDCDNKHINEVYARYGFSKENKIKGSGNLPLMYKAF